MGQSAIQRSFGAGELAPALHARADLVKYTQGARTLRNFQVRKEGGAENRAGFRFVEGAKTDTAGTRLYRFRSVSGSDFLIEAGSGYLRFFRDGGLLELAGVPAYSGATTYHPGDLVSSGGVNYYCIADTVANAPPNAIYWYAMTGTALEIPTPYTLTTLPIWKQSGNIVTLTHTSHAPRELEFVTASHWILRTVTTTPWSTTGPTGLTGTAGAAGLLTMAYVVTAAAADTFEESGATAPFTISNCAKPTDDKPNALAWTALAGATEYYVYCDPYQNGVFGFIGTASSNSFKDAGFVPDFESTPPIVRTLFDAAGEYPKTSSSFQQRRWFGHTNNEPDAIFGSRIGFPSNFGIASPLQDDDAITFRIAGNDNNPISHMEALKAGLVLLTGGGEWTVNGGGGARTPITPSSIDAEQETYVGASDVPPVIVGNTVLYVQVRGAILRELNFNQQVEGLAGKDLSIFSTHLFRRKTIAAMDYQQNPNSIIWCVLSDGTIAALTYIPEQDVWGWHRHDTDGLFETCCVIGEGEEDALYVLTSRTINGSTQRYIERLERRDARDNFFNADSFFVDCGLSYSGSPADVISGLDHLEGEVVAILADGIVIYDGDPDGADAATYTVTGGEVTLPNEAGNVHVGLPIRFMDLETLDLDASGTDIRDKRKRVQSVTLLVERSSRSFYAGPDAASLVQYVPQAWEAVGSQVTEPLSINIDTTFGETGRVLIRQTDPLPLTILGIIPNIAVGG